MPDEDDIGPEESSRDGAQYRDSYPDSARFQLGSDPSALDLFDRRRSGLLKEQLDKVPEGVTISFGQEGERKFNFGFPGVTPVFFMAEKDFSREGIGNSYTLGLGEKEGAYGTLYNVKWKYESGSWSVFCPHSAETAVLAGINLKGGALELGGVAGGVVAGKHVVGEVTFEGPRVPMVLFGMTVGRLLTWESDLRKFVQDPLGK